MSYPVAERVAKTPEIKGSDKNLLTLLALYGDHDGSNCKPGVKRLIAESGLGVRTIRRLLDRLEEDGWSIKTAEATPRSPAVYQIVLARLAVLKREGPGTPSERVQGPPLGMPERVLVVAGEGAGDISERVQGPPDSEADSKETDSKSKACPVGAHAPRARVTREDFDQLYSRHPRKVAKAAAWRAFKKLNPDAALLAVMLTALAAQKTWPDWTRDGGQYIPYPASWINGRRWEDEAPPPWVKGDDTKLQLLDPKTVERFQRGPVNPAAVAGLKHVVTVRPRGERW